ncbi:MAG TPA: hypothetical protein DDX72_10205 [Ruminococcaceae bacterium]|nr:hypothetical protein [Oscillospiraceae bacterium]
MTDNEIISLYWARDERAIKETDVRYGQFCYTLAYNVLHTKEDAEECVNDNAMYECPFVLFRAKSPFFVS